MFQVFDIKVGYCLFDVKKVNFYLIEWEERLSFEFLGSYIYDIFKEKIFSYIVLIFIKFIFL